MRWILLSLLSILALPGCKVGKIYQLPLEDTEKTEDTEKSAESGESDESEQAAQESVWDFLAKKYDADGDGVVTATEYDRGDDSFKRLDKDKNGTLTATDFKGGTGGRAARMAPQIMMRHFQADENKSELRFAELGESFAAKDADQDAELTREEFGGPERGFEALVSVVDKDADKTLSLDELEDLFKARDDGDGVWRMPGKRDLHATGAKQGTVAPDFTLQPVGGGKPVTLSSFRGKQPVALIFGSYT